MANTPATEPSSVNAGDTVRWTRSLPDYPASAGWVLAYQLVNATSRITLTGTASGDDHLIQASATSTASWASGDYAWRAQVSKAGEVFTVGEGRITVRPSFATLRASGCGEMVLRVTGMLAAKEKQAQAGA